MRARELLEALQRSRLLTPERYKTIRAQIPPECADDAGALSDWFLDEEILTEFQLGQIINKKARSLVVGHFEIRDFLGKGGMGAVYLAWDREKRRKVALKVLPVDENTNERTILRFRREMQVSQRVRHPAVASALASGTLKSVHYLAMEYVAGITLFRMVKEEGPMTGYWATRWLAEVAVALAYMHSLGVVHRDLKPSNVIITPGSKSKLLDLGLARWMEDDHNEERIVGERKIVGSFDYIAPEQAADSATADARSDIYGLGCVLYFLLAGKPPFGDVRSRKQKIIHHRKVDPPPINVVRPELPEAFAKVLAKMLAKNPKDRYQTAAEVGKVLWRWSDDLTASKKKLSRPSEETTIDGGSPGNPLAAAADEAPTVFVEDAAGDSDIDFVPPPEDLPPSRREDDRPGFWKKMGLGRLFKKNT